MLADSWSRFCVEYADSFDYSTTPPTLDPQIVWHDYHRNILDVIDPIPNQQKIRIRGEDLLSRPDDHLRKLAGWLGLRSDRRAIQEMKHPERSPFACYGPRGARFGNDPSFLKSPTLRPYREKRQDLEGPLSWRPDGAGFSTRVKRLARQFGYS